MAADTAVNPLTDPSGRPRIGPQEVPGGPERSESDHRTPGTAERPSEAPARPPGGPRRPGAVRIGPPRASWDLLGADPGPPRGVGSAPRRPRIGPQEVPGGPERSESDHRTPGTAERPSEAPYARAWP